MPILFDKGYVTKKDSKLEVTSKLMSLMLFEKAGLVSIMQDNNKLREFPHQLKATDNKHGFGGIKINAGKRA